MAAVIYCKQCDSRQPNNWTSGDLCVNCGGEVREEVRCGWCLNLTPKGKFCKHCGNEVQPDKYFGPAIILKSLGVNQFELTQKLSELPQDRLQHYQNQYIRDYRYIQRSFEDLQRLEHWTLIPGQALYSRIESALIKQIPFNDSFKSMYKKYLDTHYESDQEFLSTTSLDPCNTVVTLKQLAYLKQLPMPVVGEIDKALNNLFYGSTGISTEYTPERDEIVLFLSHINTFNKQFSWKLFFNAEGNPVDLIINILKSYLNHNKLQAYAATAIVNLLQHTGLTVQYTDYEKYLYYVGEALTNTNLSLRLTAAFLLKKEEVILATASENHPVAYYAMSWLFENNTGIIEKTIRNNALNKYQFQAVLEYTNTPGNDANILYYLAPFALSGILESRNFEEALKIGYDRIPLFLHRINFTTYFCGFTQATLNQLVSLLDRYNKTEALEIILRVKPQDGISYEALIKRIVQLPKNFSSYNEIVEKYGKWLPIIKACHYPEVEDVKIFIQFFQKYRARINQANTRNYSLMVDLIKALVSIPTEISFHISEFIIKKALDVYTHEESEWYSKLAMENDLFASDHRYIIPGNERSGQYAISDNFVQDFFDGWENFILTYNSVMALNSGKWFGSASLIEEFIKRNPTALAEKYSENRDWAMSTIEAYKETFSAEKPQHVSANLRLKTKDEYYPLIGALEDKKWDAGDVILYNSRPSDLSAEQTEQCLLRFHEWLVDDDGNNFDSQVFKEYGIHFFQFFSADSTRIPLGLIKSWLDRGAPSVVNLNKMAFYNDQFKSLIPNSGKSELATVLHKGVLFKLDAEYVFSHIFNGIEDVLAYIEANHIYGLNPQTNLFIVHLLFNCRENLLNICKEDSEMVIKLVKQLIVMACNENNSSHVKEHWLTQVIEVIIAMEPGIKNKEEYINHLLPVSEVHFSVSEKVYDAVKSSTINLIEKTPEKGLNIFYTFLKDYYLTNNNNTQWVRDVLNNKTSTITRAIQTDKSLFENTVRILINLISELHQRNDKPFALKDIEKHFINVLIPISTELFGQEVVNEIYHMIDNDLISFFNVSKLTSCLEDKGLKPVYEDASSGSTAPLVIPEDMDYDSDEIYMDIADITMFMSSFTVNEEQMNTLINHLQYYKKDRTNNPMLLSALIMKQDEVKIFLKNNTDIAIFLFQKLQEIVTDPLCGPTGPFSAYGPIAGMQLNQLLEGSIFKAHYTDALGLIASSGNYTPEHKQQLEMLLEQLRD